jgi:hypothetical protein
VAGPNTPIANEPVTVTEQVAGTGPAKDVGSVVTDADGNFTVTLTQQPVGGIFGAVFAGDTSNGNDYAAAAAPSVKVIPELFSTVDVAYTATPKSPVAKGTTVTFTGHVYVPANDHGNNNPQTPIVGAIVYVFGGSAYTSASPHAATDKKGAFSVPVKLYGTTTYNVAVVANEPWPYCLYTWETIALPTKITVAPSRQTRIEGFKVPARDEIHGNFSASGTVQQLNGKTWQAAAAASVALYYRSLPNGKWTHAGGGKAGSSGAFNWKFPFHKLGKFAWQARVTPTVVRSTGYQASASAVQDSSLVDRTYVTHFVAMHLQGSTSLAAIIQDYPQSGGAHYANVTGIAKFYYQPAGSTTWRYLGESRATSSNAGSVAIEPAGTLHGKFKIVFAAQGNFLGSSGTQSLK